MRCEDARPSPLGTTRLPTERQSCMEEVSTMTRSTELQNARSLAAEFMTGRISRRQLLGRAAALGVSLPVLGAALSIPVWQQSAAAQAGSELVIAASADIDTLDPHVSPLLMYGNIIRWTCFNSLVKYNPDLTYAGDLAESWENPDDKTYVFKLREGLKYHNGQAVEASHVEFSFKRIGEKGAIYASRVANIASYEVVDPLTIKITLTAVQADFIDGLIWLTVISPEIAETIEDKAIGTGPFKFVEWVVNDHITLEKNPDYHEAGVPAVDKLTFRIIPEAQVAISNLQSGDVQAVLDLPVSQATPLKDSSDIAALIVPTSGIMTLELMGHLSPEILSGPKVRQAIAHCLDKQAVLQTLYAGEGRAKWTWVPYGSWAYKDVPGYEYDTAKAKALLEEAGYPDGFEITVIIPSGYPDGEKTCTILQAGLAEAGIKLNLEVQELSVWVDNYVNFNHDLTWNVWPGFADPNYFVSYGMQPMFSDKGEWKNAEAKKLADDANQTLDQNERTALYGQLQDIFVADLPAIVVTELPQASLTAKNVSGWEINPLGMVIVKNASVSS
jgi:peptide/nickel transport system substrate-binding protein